MSNQNDRDHEEPTRRRHGNMGLYAICGAAAVLGIASLGAHALTNRTSAIKPASGAATAMSLTGSVHPAASGESATRPTSPTAR